MKLWICGKYIRGKIKDVVWEFNGVYDNKEVAIKECKDKDYFIAPAVLNESYLEKKGEIWPGAYYPLL